MIFCDVTIPDYDQRNCGIDFAGIVGLGLIHIDEEPTTELLENPDFWSSKVVDSPLHYWAIRNTRGQFQDSEPDIEEDIVGYQLTGAKHSAFIDVPEVKENRNFWDKVQRHNWKICLVSGGGLMYYVDRPVSFYPKISNPRSIKTAAMFQVEMKWYSLSNPYILEAPEGIFTGIYTPIGGEGVFDYTFDFTFS
jgi:hypothetical protein